MQCIRLKNFDSEVSKKVLEKKNFDQKNKIKIWLKCHDKNVFLKADRAISKLNFLFHLESMKNLVFLKKCDSHLQY